MPGMKNNEMGVKDEQGPEHKARVTEDFMGLPFQERNRYCSHSEE
jgi:hypothetical protein